MNTKIEVGDKVEVLFYEKATSSAKIKGTVTHVPCDVGDMWYIQTDKEVFAINPNYSFLLGIVKVI